MKFDRSNKFDLCYYGQVNSLRLKSSIASKWASKHLWGYHLFCWRWYIYSYASKLLFIVERASAYVLYLDTKQTDAVRGAWCYCQGIYLTNGTTKYKNKFYCLHQTIEFKFKIHRKLVKTSENVF